MDEVHYDMTEEERAELEDALDAAHDKIERLRAALEQSWLPNPIIQAALAILSENDR